MQTHMTLRKWLPEMDEATLSVSHASPPFRVSLVLTLCLSGAAPPLCRKAEVQRFELGIIDVARDLMASGKESLVVLPGVTRLLDELRAAAAQGDGPERMAIVTSASKACACHFGTPREACLHLS